MGRLCLYVIYLFTMSMMIKFRMNICHDAADDEASTLSRGFDDKLFLGTSLDIRLPLVAPSMFPGRSPQSSRTIAFWGSHTLWSMHPQRQSPSWAVTLVVKHTDAPARLQMCCACKNLATCRSVSFGVLIKWSASISRCGSALCLGFADTFNPKVGWLESCWCFSGRKGTSVV